jgi:xanthine dehydrogenase accessory factor
MNHQTSNMDIHQTIVDWAGSGRRFALAVILKDTGSTPRKAGTKALINRRGAIWGTLGGGAVEAEAQRRAPEAIRSGRPEVFDFALEGETARDASPICGGVMRILIDPTVADQRAVHAQAAEACRGRRRGVLITAIHGDPLPRLSQGEARPCHGEARTAVQWFPADALPTDAGFPALEVLRSALAAETPQLLVQEAPQEGGRVEVLVEPLIPPPQLVIAGGGHIGQALALQAGLVGFQMAVIDDRSEYVDPSLYPEGTDLRCGDIARLLAETPAAADTYIVIVTRGHQQDRQALAACIRRPAAYVGMIGSRRKVAMIRKDLLESDAATQEELGRVYAPIGLDIGAQTVGEIAASITAQLIAVRRRGSAPRMPTE